MIDAYPHFGNFQSVTLTQKTIVKWKATNRT